MKLQNNSSNIQIKGIFSEWRQVPKEQAREFVKYLLASGMTCYDIEKCESNDTAIPKLHKYIERTYLKGITVEELMKEGN